ncbi:glycosyltransferase involved in cell wall biosynthesis [Chryseobacterium ginsenosidimutans]|uniref:glycosyltransferase family 2 protein n=1 Tax=Chryseobacterium ginsenosidimutans TaxID=687846 RepID=UPI00277FA3F3|nr:glycosyltransferase family 2 protein [Chryseobacterium ginsenosidimutans]MDQ0591901.1 glycosyltransferase involved in cell wall biosynthesis [Chryseobacterium ginsenosidimutans]
MNQPLLSVVMITYNHEDYIEEAINGVLLQDYDGKIELILANDNSPDNTDVIIQKVLQNHTGSQNIEIKYTKHQQNKGMMPNFLWALQQAQGDYIALCDGDDYWTDPLKIQKQVDFLEKNPEYSFTFHKVSGIGSENAENSIFKNIEEEKDYTLENLSEGNFIHTPSVVFRKNVNKLPDWLSFCPIGDYPLHMINSTFGKIKYFPETMAVYRVGSGIWSTTNLVHQVLNIIYTLKFLLEYFKNNKVVYHNLKKQHDNHYNSIVKNFEAKRSLELKTKDYRYLESITDFGSILKILKMKILKKVFPSK